MEALPIVVGNNFQAGFAHFTDQNAPFKRWKQMGNSWSKLHQIISLKTII